MAFMDLFAFAHDTNAGGSGKLTIGDTTTSYDALTSLKGLQDFCVPIDHFSIGRLEHTLQSRLDVFDQFINDIVVTDIDLFTLRFALCRRISLHVKSDDNGS